MRIRRGVEEELEIAKKGGGREIERKKEVEGREGKMKRIIYPTNCQMER